MQKEITKIEVTIADKTYQFFCDPDSPIGHVKEALFQVSKHVGKIEDHLLEQQAAVAPTKEEILLPEDECIKKEEDGTNQ